MNNWSLGHVFLFLSLSGPGLGLSTDLMFVFNWTRFRLREFLGFKLLTVRFVTFNRGLQDWGLRVELELIPEVIRWGRACSPPPLGEISTTIHTCGQFRMKIHRNANGKSSSEESNLWPCCSTAGVLTVLLPCDATFVTYFMVLLFSNLFSWPLPLSVLLLLLLFTLLLFLLLLLLPPSSGSVYIWG